MGRVQALYVGHGSQATKAGLRSGDILLKINGVPVSTA